MVKKLCPQCRNYSYSAKTSGNWVCPTCGFDLTASPMELIERSNYEVSQSKGKLVLVYGTKKSLKS